MSNRIPRSTLAALLLLSTLNLQLSTLFAQSTAFTYQGQLVESGLPYNGVAEMQFTLFNTPSGGAAIATNTPPVSSINVSNGLFVVALDFGAAAFPGEERWLEIQVRVVPDAFSTLSPRQKITATPYALTARTVTGVVPGTGLAGTYEAAMTFSNVGNSFAGNGAGLVNVNAATLGGSSSSNFWNTIGNGGTIAGTHFLGTTDNQPLEIKVNGLRALRMEPNTNGAPNLIGGSPRNFVGAGVVGATISGGGAINHLGRAFTNSVSGDFGVVGGGYDNHIGAKSEVATIAGGRFNTIGTNSAKSAVGGGESNRIAASTAVAVIAGGNFNEIGVDCAGSVIGGGQGNKIGLNARFSTIPGGIDNEIDPGSSLSFAAGNRAKANHVGTFVWADATSADFASTGGNQFLIRAGGGVGIGTSNPEYPLDVAGGVRLTRFGDGVEILNLSTERSWAFRQLRSGSGTALELASIGGGGNKDFIINTTGFVGIGTTAPGFNLHVNGTAGKPGGGSWSSASDARLKKNICPLASALDKLLALHGVSFEYIDPAKIHELSGERMGLVAQEVEKVFPDWVETGPDGYKRVTVRGLEALVVEALRELQHKLDARNENLAAELKRLDAENTELNRRLERLEQRLNNQGQNER